jgi:hypothetical protein
VSARAALAFMLGGLVLLVVAGLVIHYDRPPPEQTCTEAADRWDECVPVTIGPIANKLLTGGKRDIPACVADEMTVAMYERCLPEPDCVRFWQCLQEFVKE